MLSRVFAGLNKMLTQSSDDLIAWQMADTLWSMGSVVSIKKKKAQCQRCGREFMSQASNPKNAPLYCSDGCRCWSRHFRRKREKQATGSCEVHYLSMEGTRSPQILVVFSLRVLRLTVVKTADNIINKAR